eukprot:5144824-Prymnesium_polylepis.1
MWHGCVVVFALCGTGVWVCSRHAARVCVCVCVWSRHVARVCAVWSRPRGVWACPLAAFFGLFRPSPEASKPPGPWCGLIFWGAGRSPDEHRAPLGVGEARGDEPSRPRREGGERAAEA